MRNAGNLYAAGRVAAGLSSAETAVLSGIALARLRAAERSPDFDESGMSAISNMLRRHNVSIDRDRFCVTFPKTEEDQDVGRLIAVARVAIGMSQKDLASASGVSLRTVSSLENGSPAPTSAIRDALLASLSRRGATIDVDPHAKDRWAVYVLSPEKVLPRKALLPGITHFEAVNQRLSDWAADTQRPMMMTLRIEVNGTSPLVWREVLIPENATFADLHAAIQVAFGWRWCHLHAFHCGVIIGNPKELSDGSAADALPVDERLVTLQSLDLSCRSFQYVYDFGDNWVHTVKLGERVPRGDRPARPILVDGAYGPMIEDSGSYEGFNDLAERIRHGEADSKTMDWLHRCGYGRDYDPDAFDAAAIDEQLMSAPFDIPKTWDEEFQRRSEMNVIAPHSVKDYPRPASLPRKPVNGLVVTSVEEFSRDDFWRDGMSDPDQGIVESPSIKSEDGTAVLRLENSMLSSLLDMSSDIKSFRTFPLAVRWRVGSRDGVFHPEIRVTGLNGKSRLVHVAVDDEDAEFALKLVTDHGIDMTVVANGFYDAPQVLNCKEVRRWRQAGVRGEHVVSHKRVAKLLGERGLSNGIEMSEAVSLVLNEGLDASDLVQGGKPEGRVKAQICAAIADGLIGVDFGRPLDETTLGLPKLSADTCKFWPLVKDYVIR